MGYTRMTIKQLRAALARMADEPVTGLLEDGDVPHASAAWDRAFLNDPLLRYTRVVPDTPKIVRRRKFGMGMAFRGWIRSSIALTVDHGTSVVIAKLSNSVPESTKAKVIDWFIKHMFRFLGRHGSKEQKERTLEYRTKVDAVVKDTLGESLKSMIFVSLVFTDPQAGGRGYASGLLRKITQVADLFDESAWLVSSNVVNEAFYNSHGFITVGEAVVGDNNPTYDGRPIIVQIMVRDPNPGLNEKEFC